MGVRAWFAVTGREQALRRSEVVLEKYEALAAGLLPGAGGRCVEVPPMRGVDEDMRQWSFFMILEHNAIVNRSITATVVQLARGEPLSGAARDENLAASCGWRVRRAHVELHVRLPLVPAFAAGASRR